MATFVSLFCIHMVIQSLFNSNIEFYIIISNKEYNFVSATQNNNEKDQIMQILYFGCLATDLLDFPSKHQFALL